MPIRGPIRDVGKRTAVYGFGNMLTKLAAFLLIPIYTRFLTQAEVGIVALFEMVEMFLLPVILLGVNNALWRYLPQLTEEQRRQFISSALCGVLLFGIVLTGMVSMNYRGFALKLGLPEAQTTLFLILLLNTLLLVVPRFLLALWQYDGRSVAYVAVSLIQFVGILCLTLYLVVAKELGLWGVVVAKTIVLGTIFLYAVPVVLKTNFVLPSLGSFLKLVRYGGPLLLMILVAPVLTFSDRFFLRIFVPLEEIGVYSIGYKFGMLINMMLVIPLRRSWNPMMYQLGLSEDKRVYFRDILFYFAVMGAFLSLGIIFLSRPIISFFATEAYLSAVSIIPLITFAYYINGFRQFFSAGAALKDRTPRLGIVSVAGILVNLLLNFFLIREYGVPGAAWSTLISYSLLTGLVYYVSQPLVKIRWGWRRLLKLLAVTAVTLLVATVATLLWSGFDIVVGILGLGFFVVLLLVTGTVGRREMNGLKSMIAEIGGAVRRSRG